ncbi:hypothetical protein ACEPAG_3325 [Sanghuangporus baumii]
MATSAEKKGTLTIAGTGIASVKHITLEALSYIKEAAKVYYLVVDPVTEAFIRDNARGECLDLYVFYDTNKSRYDSYVQMCEVMLRDVRAGHDVLGVFYGHPGVFVAPSHRAIAIARDEGFKARMLPGISAEDYLIADVGFDPAMHGCASFEATELLVRGKPLNPSTNNIIWQVGSVGVSTMVFDNAKFNLLVDYLEDVFGADHKIVHYIGAILPQCEPTIEAFTVAELRKDEVVKKINPASTFYIPPRAAAKFEDAMAQKLGITDSGRYLRGHFPPVPFAGPEFGTTPAYGSREKAAVAKIDKDSTPTQHKIFHASDAMKKLTTDLALYPKLLDEYRANPAAYVEAVEGLTEQEKTALALGSPGAIEAVMATDPSGAASGREMFAATVVTTILIIIAV